MYQPHRISGLGVLLALAVTGAPTAAAAQVAHAQHAAPAEHAAVPTELAAELAEVFRVSHEYLDYDRAVAAGFSRLTPCDADAQAGAQGYHYAIKDRIDGEVDLREPEILMYEPRPDGSMRLVGVEYIIPFTERPQTEEPPTLLGQRFMANTRYEVWALHVWLHQFNPSGLFATWNPLVSCAHARD